MPRTADAPQFTTTNAGSLLTTANWQQNQDRLANGVSFKPEGCDNGSLLELCPAEPVTKTFSSDNPPVTVPTYADFYGEDCSTMAGSSEFDETAARARRGLEVRQSFKVERGLWDGLGTITDSSALASTAADDITAAGPSGLTSGIGQMIAALNTVLGGARGIIHIPQWALVFPDFYGLMTRNGNILQVTGTDHVFVAGTGYSGNDPDGNAAAAGETWIYGTGPVNVLTSSISVLPDFGFQAIDRSVNTVEVRAEFAFAAYFNPCAHIALNVCLPEPGPDCEGS